jgi:hypothetical protein
MTTSQRPYGSGRVAPESDEAPAGDTAQGFREDRSSDKCDSAADSLIAQVVWNSPLTFAEARKAGIWPREGIPDSLRELPPELLSIYAEYAFGMLRDYGYDPATRPKVAAHEAGHAIVAHALGDTVHGARIVWAPLQPSGGAWAGRTEYTEQGSWNPEHGLLTPRLILREIARNVAGVAGEYVARLVHRTSALDEVFLAQMYSKFLTDEYGRKFADSFRRVRIFCANLIMRNRVAFDALRSHLSLTGRLTETEAARMLASVAREVLE